MPWIVERATPGVVVPIGALITPGGQPGPAGQSFVIKGTITDPPTQLPPTGNTIGDAYIDSTTGDAYMWNGTEWVNLGPGLQQGPPGPQGPAGPQGPPGSNGSDGAVYQIKGQVDTEAQLPPTGNAPGDIWIVKSTGHGWAWDASTSSWIDIGLLSGESGAAGPVGDQGKPGYTLTTLPFTVPSVGFVVVVTVENSDWLAIGQYVWVQGAGAAGDAAELIIQGITNQTVITLFNPAPAAVPGTLIPVGNLITSGGRASSEFDTLLQALVATVMPPGMVQDYAGPLTTTPPNGWLFCDGSPVSRTQYAALYAAIGTSWGTGDNSTTFNLPDLRGKSVIGQGQGPGLSNRVLASTGGEENHLLILAEMAAHNHVGSSATSPPHQHLGHTQGHNHNFSQTPHQHTSMFIDIAGTQWQAGSGWGWQVQDVDPANANITFSAAGDLAALTDMTTAVVNLAITTQGGGATHNNMQPYAVCYKIIKT